MSFAAEKLAERLRANISRAVIGKDTLIDRVIVACLCGGHILLEDIPGTGKTTLVKALARSIGCGFRRIQFTPDLLPSDVTGINYYQQKEGAFLFKPGPVFINILLADELNRATPRTQSSLLECMEERQVTVDGVTYPMEPFFLVAATQNPIETQGTFPLPEAQLDRFFMKLSVGYPSHADGLSILEAYTGEGPAPLETLEAVTSPEELLEARREAERVLVSPPIQEYVLQLTEATRQRRELRLGVSPRGALALMRAAQGEAAIHGRDYVLPDDVKALCPDVLAHRLICRDSSLLRQTDPARSVLDDILAETAAPSEPLER